MPGTKRLERQGNSPDATGMAKPLAENGTLAENVRAA